jgi:hypothetical protein
MSNSARIGLPFLDAAQAQKHVTMNEALALLDAAAAARVETMATTSPPPAPADGEAHIVPAGAGGGWEFIPPWAGWRLWVASQMGLALHDGSDWRLESQPVSPGGALSALRVAEIDHAIVPGATSETTALIPDKAIVLGVTGRVLTAITGAAGWQLGVAGSPDRYGSGIGVGANSFLHGVTGSPLAYFGGSSLLLTAEGGDFIGGLVRIAVHYHELSPPRAV